MKLTGSIEWIALFIFVFACISECRTPSERRADAWIECVKWHNEPKDCAENLP